MLLLYCFFWFPIHKTFLLQVHITEQISIHCWNVFTKRHRNHASHVTVRKKTKLLSHTPRNQIKSNQNSYRFFKLIHAQSLNN